MEQKGVGECCGLKMLDSENNFYGTSGLTVLQVKTETLP